MHTQLTWAGSEHLPSIRALLVEAGLPIADLENGGLVRFLIALTHTGAITGVVGIEQYDDVGLLRSLAVSPGQRGRGLGAQLVASLETHSKQSGIRVLFLLTTTAARFFATQGYQPADRDRVPQGIADTEEFRSLCPVSAACLYKNL